MNESDPQDRAKHWREVAERVGVELPSESEQDGDRTSGEAPAEEPCYSLVARKKIPNRRPRMPSDWDGLAARFGLAPPPPPPVDKTEMAENMAESAGPAPAGQPTREAGGPAKPGAADQDADRADQPAAAVADLSGEGGPEEHAPAVQQGADAEAVEAESQEARASRRRRRRGRRRRRRSEPEAADAAAEESGDRLAAETPAEGQREAAAAEDAAAAEPPPEGEAESERPAAAVEHQQARDPADEQDGGQPGGAEQQKAKRSKTRRFPTWEEAVGVVIAANMEARQRNGGEGGRGGRGRGRGRARRKG